MTDGFRAIFLLAMGAWLGALVLGSAAMRLLLRRGRDAAWPALRTLGPLLALAGTWAGFAAGAALLLGRRGFGPAWAVAMGLVALMFAAALYDRAALQTSLDSAWKRLAAGEQWEEEWRFLWRMGAWLRAGMIVGGAGAAACGLLA